MAIGKNLTKGFVLPLYVLLGFCDTFMQVTNSDTKLISYRSHVSHNLRKNSELHIWTSSHSKLINMHLNYTTCHIIASCARVGVSQPYMLIRGHRKLHHSTCRWFVCVVHGQDWFLGVYYIEVLGCLNFFRVIATLKIKIWNPQPWYCLFQTYVLWNIKKHNMLTR